MKKADEKNWILVSRAKQFFPNWSEMAQAAGCSPHTVRQAHWIKNPDFVRNLRKAIAKRFKELERANRQIQKGGSG